MLSVVSLICVDNLLRVSFTLLFPGLQLCSNTMIQGKRVRGQLHECLRHFVPVRAVCSFCCPDLSFSHVLASTVLHSLSEITETIHDFKVKHMLTSIAVSWMAHLVHHNIKACIENLQVVILCLTQ